MLLIKCVLLLLLRYLGSKAVKLFKVRMHGSDAVSSGSVSHCCMNSVMISTKFRKS